MNIPLIDSTAIDRLLRDTRARRVSCLSPPAKLPAASACGSCGSGASSQIDYAAVKRCLLSCSAADRDVVLSSLGYDSAVIMLVDGSQVRRFVLQRSLT